MMGMISNFQNLGFVLLPIWVFIIFPCMGYALFFQGWVFIMGITEFPIHFPIMESTGVADHMH